ncbi:hypothetical protein FRC01_012662, partial [Tulasnella sp. 417]
FSASVGPPMHHALSIPEILQLVLSSGVCRATMRNAALTCTLWKDAALDELWKDLDSVFPLIWVLVRLEIEQTADTRFPLPSNWSRLGTYVRRVRTLVFDVFPPAGRAIALKTLQTVAQLRPPGRGLLPNLRKFTYIPRDLPEVDTVSQFLVFLGPSIVELKLVHVASSAVPALLEYVAQWTPQVQRVQIEDHFQKSYDGSSAFASSLLKLKKLTSLEAEVISLTPVVWDAMARHSSLLSARVLFLSSLDSVAAFQPRVFAKLASLTIRAKFDRLCGLFGSQNDLPTLTRVSLTGPSVPQARSDFRRLCELLVQKLPNLACVEVAFCWTPALDGVPLGFKDFRPLLQCNKLQRVQLGHSCGVSVTAGEVSELLDAWPGIQALALQYTREVAGLKAISNWTPPTLPLRVLDTVAAKAPNIKKLGLILDASTPIGSAPSTCRWKFECLQELNVTLSTVGQPGNVASYLAQRCRKRFSVRFVPPALVDGIAMQEITEEKAKWDQVEEHLRLLFDQKERLEDEFEMRLEEERAKYIRE